MEKCSFCGADKVLNPKTGKMFCKDKCWVNGPKVDQPKIDQSEKIIEGIRLILEKLEKIKYVVYPEDTAPKL
jgi:hypothetical protein